MSSQLEMPVDMPFKIVMCGLLQVADDARLYAAPDMQSSPRAAEGSIQIWAATAKVHSVLISAV